MSNETFVALKRALGTGRIKEMKDISPYFTLRTTTCAEYFFEAETKEDLKNAIKITKKLELPLLLIGGGSNLAVTRAQIHGLVVRNLYQKKEVIRENEEFVEVLFSSGYS